MPASEIEGNLNRLEAELKRLEAEYNMFFAGRLPKPPWETRSRVDALIKAIDRAPIQNLADRFRFSTVQARYAAFRELWERGLRAREEGRSGPFTHVRTDQGESSGPTDRVVFVASFQNPMQEMDKLHELYDSLVEARRETGADSVPFETFANLVKTQVEKLQAVGNHEVAFLVALKDGNVNLTARALRGAVDDE